MTYVSIGDLARQFQLSQHSTQMKADLSNLGEELASGQVSNVAAAVSGDFAALSGIDHSLSNLGAFKTSADEATLFANAVQDSLGHVQDVSNTLASALLTASNTENPTIISAAANDAEQKFGSVISSLNTQVGDRSLLSGVATDSPALASTDIILSALLSAVSGQTTAAGVKTVVDAWFDTPGGGFDSVAYTGSTAALSPFQIGPDQKVTIDAKANNDAVRNALKGFALTSLVAKGALPGNNTEQSKLVRMGGEALLTSQRGMSNFRAGIGSAQARIDEAITYNQTQISTLKIARSDIISADPYKTATQLQTVQTGLETLYTLTARMSRLSLVNFLR